MLKVNYINKIIGDFKINELLKRRNNIAVYKATCLNCGYTRSGPIWTIKHSCECSKCKKAKTANEKFKLVENKVFRGYKVIGYTYKKEKLRYKLHCENCNNIKWISCTKLNNVPRCTCNHHINGKLIAKHNNEIVGDFLLKDTGKNAYNSRNRLYQAICTHCGRIKQGMYHDLKTHDLCTCHKY
jgi:predicted Zn-ribbon and HTH transcriptional regulator